MNTTNSENLFNEAKTYFPGGVNSPVRAFKSVDGNPLFFKKGKGSKVWDEDDNEFIDFCCSWGPLILGHDNDNVREKIINTVKNGTSFGVPTRLENQLGKLILDNNRFIDKIRFVSSGTEATMSAIRMARGYTGRNKIIKFEGCYHGHADGLLVKAGSGLATFGTSSSAGVPENYVKETIVLPLNDKQAVEEAFSIFKDDIACIIIEPIPANNGLLLQDKSFLNFLRQLCTQEKALLFFDEVISGFRVGFEGAAGYYNIQPDIVAYGKIIGGGLPVGAYGASEKIMSSIAPIGPVYQAGTLSGNPVAMAAGLAQLTECLAPGFYTEMENKTKAFVNNILSYANEHQFAFNIFSVGSIFWIAFSNKDNIQKASEIDDNSMNYFKVLHKELLKRGVYMGPSGYEVGFISKAHSEEDLKIAANAFKEALKITFQPTEIAK